MIDIFNPQEHEAVRAALGGENYPAAPISNRGDLLWKETRQRAIDSLYFFTTAVLGWNKLRPKPHKEMCDYIQDQLHPRKVLLVPRDCYKSTIASKSLPLWIVIQPMFMGLPGREHRMLLMMHSADNAKKQIQSIKHQVERNQMLQWLFPEIIPDFSSDKWTDIALQFPREGLYGEATIECAGIETHVVSRHYTIQIKDDLEDLASYESPTVRKKVKSAYKAAEALFVDEKEAFDLIVGTRWGSDDMYSDIQSQEADTYVFHCRPLHWTRNDLERDIEEAKKNSRLPVWNMDPDKYAPDPDATYYYFPEHFPAESCKRLRAKMGEWMYSMLYLNNPHDESLMEFKGSILRDCWMATSPDSTEVYIAFEDHQGNTIRIPFDALGRTLFWDPALSERAVKNGSDSCIVVLGHDRTLNWYLLDVFLQRKDPTKLLDKYIGMHQKWLCHKAGIEDAGFQRVLKFPLYQRMMELNHHFPVIAQPPHGEKDFRIRGLIPIAESFKFFIRRGLDREVRAQFEGFPQYPKKDVPDCVAAARELTGNRAFAKDEFTRHKEKMREDRRLAGRSTVTGY